jgi:hypothetical protein
MTVDDYTNDLCSRDYLELVVRRLPPDISKPLSHLVASLDDKFREGTTEDDEGLLGRFFRIDPASSWWWQRIPSAGPLAEFSPLAAGIGGLRSDAIDPECSPSIDRAVSRQRRIGPRSNHRACDCSNHRASSEATAR